MPFVHCPACDEEMEIEANWYGRKVACPSCDKQFVAHRPGEAEDGEQHDRARRRTRAWEDDDEEDDRPLRKKKHRPERPMPMGRGTKQLILTAAVVVPILLMCLGCGGWLAFTIFAPVSYSEPWVTQALPDQSYSVQFPKAPSSEPMGDLFNGNTGVKYVYDGDMPNAEEFAFGYLDGALDFDTVYRLELDNMRRTIGAKVAKERDVTSAGCRGKEAELSVGGAKVVYRILDASEGGRRRYLLVLGGGRKVSETDRNKFLDSLKRGP